MPTKIAETEESRSSKDRPDPAITAFVVRSGLAPSEAAVRLERLPGGVSSDIWLVRAGSAAFCVKRALPRLRVAADWRVPIERNAKEAAWIKAVARFLPQAVPRLLAEDAGIGMFAMEYLPPRSFEGWKAQLRRRHVMPFTAAEIGHRLASIHGRFARSCAVEAEFATDEIFHAIRLEPYLLATARVHPDRAAALERLAEITARTKLTLVHGDVSPKNILAGPRGPVFIDAECAWFGDPAFDAAFCINHLLLKSAHLPALRPQLLNASQRFLTTWLAALPAAAQAPAERRLARLLP